EALPARQAGGVKDSEDAGTSSSEKAQAPTLDPLHWFRQRVFPRQQHPGSTQLEMFKGALDAFVLQGWNPRRTAIDRWIQDDEARLSLDPIL
ncbi:hypothetical protein FRC01_006688, partial [Tulasnella sp. 417]